MTLQERAEKIIQIIRYSCVESCEDITSQEKQKVADQISEAEQEAKNYRPDWWASRYEDGRKSGFAEARKGARGVCLGSVKVDNDRCTICTMDPFQLAEAISAMEPDEREDGK